MISGDPDLRVCDPACLPQLRVGVVGERWLPEPLELNPALVHAGLG